MCRSRAPAALSLTQTTPSLDNAPGGTSQSGGTYTVAVAANSERDEVRPPIARIFLGPDL